MKSRLPTALLLPLTLLACPADSTPVPAQSPTSSSTTSTPEPTKSTQTTETAPGNVLIILADDLGVDSVAAYERHPIPATTPVIDGLAAEGVRFDRAYAYPVCSPTRAALLTGRYGRRHGVMAVIPPSNSGKQLSTDEVTIPAMLKASPFAYTSVAIGKWHLNGFTSDDAGTHPWAMGFDDYEGSVGNLQDHSLDPGDMTPGYHFWQKLDDSGYLWEETYATTDNVDAAIAQIQSLPEPWLIYLPLNAPHTPLTPAPVDLVTVPVSENDAGPYRYRALLEAMDTELGRLLGAMPAATRDNTTILFLGDNGTSEQGTMEPWRSDHAKHTPYEGGIQVPFIVSGRGVTDPGRTHDALIHVVDVLPTVAELAGVPLASIQTTSGTPVSLDGASLVPYLVDPTVPGQRDVLYTEWGSNGSPPYINDWQILRDDQYKLIRGHSATDEFYDLWDPHPDDGNESDNLLDPLAPPLTLTQQEAYDRLVVALEAQVATIAYAGP